MRTVAHAGALLCIRREERVREKGGVGQREGEKERERDLRYGHPIECLFELIVCAFE